MAYPGVTHSNLSGFSSVLCLLPPGMMWTVRKEDDGIYIRFALWIEHDIGMH